MALKDTVYNFCIGRLVVLPRKKNGQPPLCNDYPKIP
jgi:hypothetical protein